ncbi:hypothetical protein [Pontibacter burrus]|uniref:O-antigen ligase domain-containing protein n=1 Tax=Pontibacter burrus TaxID=2704466 RepID=A0A6B3LUU1_9BACT|nr:hypothetical protein [Pontibacter burrus]NEM97264.1 hypothetical protein [Pontibacter burrus]
MSNFKALFQYSLAILLVFGIVETLYDPSNGSLGKLLINICIYISLLFIPFEKTRGLTQDFSKGITIIIYLLIGYGLINICRNLDDGQFLSLFGNPYYGPSFLIPVFILWATKKNALYWLNRLSLISVQIGIILLFISLSFDLPLPVLCFLPTFFLLLNYPYVSKNDKVWIILSTFLGAFVFWQSDMRIGIVRIILCFGIFIISQLDIKWFYKFSAIVMLSIVVFGATLGVITGKSLFIEISSVIESNFNVTDLATDTRTFLYTEVFSDLDKTDSFILGKGPIGTYYSDYFYFLNDEDGTGDHHIRHNVEVGVLHYLLKGGVIYLILIAIINIYAIYNALSKVRNRYVRSLGLLTAANVMVLFIENIPSYSILFALIWIITGVCTSKWFKKLNDRQIKLLTQRLLN